jgi:hypothetical protein
LRSIHAKRRLSDEADPYERAEGCRANTSDDPALAGEIPMTWTLRPIGDATQVRRRGLSAADHAVGLASSLAKLAVVVEGKEALAARLRLPARMGAR